MSEVTFIRPSGTEITVSDNEANRALAKASGWVEASKDSKKDKVKKAAK